MIVHRSAVAVFVTTIALVASGVLASTAFAYGDDGGTADPAAWVNLSSEDQHAVLEFLSRDTPAESTHYATRPGEQSKAQALEDAYNDTRPDDAKAALVADAGRAAEESKFIPSIDDIHASLAWPIVVRPGGLLTLDVLLIGLDATYLMQLVGHDIQTPPPAGVWTTDHYEYWWHNAGPIYSPPAPQTLPAGVYAEHVGQNSISTGFGFSDDDPSPRTAPPYPVSAGQRFYWNETHGNWDVDGHWLESSVVYYVRVGDGEWPFEVSARPRRATPSDSGASAPWGPPADPSANLGPGYGDPPLSDLRKWICHVLGEGCPDPYRDYHMTPDCAAMTFDGCVTALRNAGFTGKIDEEHLTADEAYMGGQPGLVTTTRPAPNLSIVEDREFEVFVNPDPLPTPTATEQSVAAALLASNPAVVTHDIALTLARECVRLASAAGKPTNDCLARPIFVTGKDAGTPARNDIAALASNPQWFELNHRESIPHKQWWVYASPRPDGCIVGIDDNMTDPQCHEFPFWSTLQAYGGTLQTAVPRIQWTPAIENQRQGAALRQFYSTNSVGTLGFAGCNVPAQSQYDTQPMVSSTFLNLPLPPGMPFASTGICNTGT